MKQIEPDDASIESSVVTPGLIRGNTVAVLGSGPSLTVADIDRLREAGIPFVAVNTTWEIARDCHALVAGDLRWWKAHADSIDIDCVRVSRSKDAQKRYGARALRSRVPGGYNSGMVAAEWLIRKRANLIILLGMDCSLDHGLHHHGEHTLTPNPTRHRVARWHAQWESLGITYPGANIVNCSRYTTLTAFPTRSLEAVICAHG